MKLKNTSPTTYHVLDDAGSKIGRIALSSSDNGYTARAEVNLQMSPKSSDIAFRQLAGALAQVANTVRTSSLCGR